MFKGQLWKEAIEVAKKYARLSKKLNIKKAPPISQAGLFYKFFLLKCWT